MTENQKIYFVSDVHLGAPALKNNRKRELLFAEWLDEIKKDATGLFLLGDIFDFWFEYRKVVPRGFTRILGRLAQFTDNGIPVHFFTGNHDLWVFDYLPSETGVVVHKNELLTELNGSRFFLAHGDDFDENDKAYHRLKKIFTNKKLQWLFSRIHPNFAFYIAHKWSASSSLSKTNKQEEFKVKNDGIYKFAENYLNREFVDYFIFGHRHKMADVKIGEKTRFVMLGDWITNYSYGVFNGETFKLLKFREPEV